MLNGRSYATIDMGSYPSQEIGSAIFSSQQESKCDRAKPFTLSWLCEKGEKRHHKSKRWCYFENPAASFFTSKLKSFQLKEGWS